MYAIQKLKPDRNFYPLLIPFSFFVIAAFFGLVFGYEAAMLCFAVLFWIYAAYTLLTWIRTHNTGFLVVAGFQVAAGLVAYNLIPASRNPDRVALMLFFLACEVFLLAWTVILAFAKKTKWRGREVLELAAAAVEQVGNGYTPRPLPAGKTEFSQSQVMKFSEFARRHLVAVPYVGKDKVVFVPVMEGREFGFILGLKNDYTDETWVAFDFDGKVSVNIAHRDYLEYKESLAFDQLCESLGDVFVDFIQMYLRGEGVRVIDRLNAVGVSVFS